MAYKCSGCQASAPDKKKVEHNEGCRKKKIVAFCTKSGQKPHVRNLK